MLRRTFIQSPALPAATRLKGRGAKELDAAVRAEIQRFDGTVCLYAKNLATGAEYGLREDKRVRTASTIKLPVMAALFDRVKAGAVRWDEMLPLREEDKVSGSGVLHEFSAGVRLPVRDVMHLMIVVSDNTATNLILDRIGTDTVNSFLDTLELKQTRSLRKVLGDGKEPGGWSRAGLLEENKPYGLGVSTSREMVRLMELLDRGEVVGAEASKEMLGVLRRQQFKDGIGRRLPDASVASKSGSLDALRSDVALVDTPKGRVAMAVTVDGMKKVDYSQENAGLLLISRLAMLLLEGLAG